MYPILPHPALLEPINILLCPIHALSLLLCHCFIAPHPVPSVTLPISLLPHHSLLYPISNPHPAPVTVLLQTVRHHGRPSLTHTYPMTPHHSPNLSHQRSIFAIPCPSLFPVLCPIYPIRAPSHPISAPSCFDSAPLRPITTSYYPHAPHPCRNELSSSPSDPPRPMIAHSCHISASSCCMGRLTTPHKHTSILSP